MTFDLNAYRSTSNWDSIPSNYLESALEETVESELFPGFVLPAFVDGNVRWYAIAEEQRDWRALQPILLAYVGHTVTDFDGEPSILDPNVEVEALLAMSESHAVARLQAPKNRHAFAIRALQRMKECVFARPKNLRPPPISTGSMLSRFDMCLVEGDRAGARNWLERLRRELRLDALNLNFITVKYRATFRDWEAILSAPTFGDLVRVRKPLIIAHNLLEALWFGRLERHSNDWDGLKVVYETEARGYVADILSLSGIPSDWAANTYKDLFATFHSNAEQEALLPSSTLPEPIGVAPYAAEVTDNTKQQASPAHQLEQIKAENWLEWIQALDKRGFSFREEAERLAVSSTPETIVDSEDVRIIEEALYEVDGERSLPRLNETLPYLIKWLKTDEYYPRKMMAPLYDVVLLRLIESRNRESEFREALTDLFTALLEVGLSADSYKQLLTAVNKAIPDGAGTSDVYWLLDVAGVLCQFSASEESARNTLLNHILASLTPVLRRMTLMQRSTYANVAASAGWDEIEIETETDDAEKEDGILNGMYVGIYTLTESAGRQTETALKRLYPKVRVEVSSDKVATARLQSLSQNADILVVTASSAKHAATDCIRDNRPADRIVYAAGKGFGSIMRAIEEHIATLRIERYAA